MFLEQNNFSMCFSFFWCRYGKPNIKKKKQLL